MQVQDISKAYITYDYDAVTRSHLLTDKRYTVYTVSHGFIKFDLLKPPKRSVLYHMENIAGFTVKTKETLTEAGTKNIFGIKGTRSKIIKLDRKPFIEVRIQANSPTELYENIFKFRSEMNKYHVSEQMCTWDKIGDLTLNPELPTDKTIIEYDKKEIKLRKQLELRTFRQN